MVLKADSKQSIGKTALLFSLIVMLVIALGGCGSKEKPTRTKKIKEGGLELSIVVAEGDFAVGKEIPVTISVKNVGPDIEVLSFNTAQRIDMEVKNSEGKAVWRWSEGQMFAQNLEQVKLKPDDREDNDATWSQKDSAGNQVPPGKYTFIARSMTDEMNNKTVTIDVKIVK